MGLPLWQITPTPPSLRYLRVPVQDLTQLRELMFLESLSSTVEQFHVTMRSRHGIPDDFLMEVDLSMELAVHPMTHLHTFVFVQSMFSWREHWMVNHRTAHRIECDACTATSEVSHAHYCRWVVFHQSIIAVHWWSSSWCSLRFRHQGNDFGFPIKTSDASCESFSSTRSSSCKMSRQSTKLGTSRVDKSWLLCKSSSSVIHLEWDDFGHPSSTKIHFLVMSGTLYRGHSSHSLNCSNCSNYENI